MNGLPDVDRGSGGCRHMKVGGQGHSRKRQSVGDAVKVTLDLVEVVEGFLPSISLLVGVC